MNDCDLLQRAILLSKQSFEKEEALRKQAIELEEQLKRKRAQQWSQQKCYNALMSGMKWQPLFQNRGVGCGLQNLGNSCFMNATLQCLAYTAPFSQLLCQSNHSQSCQSKGFCSLCEMERVLPSMLLNKRIFHPRDLFKHIPSINDLLTPGCQEDAHEFLQSLLDKMEIAYDDQYKANHKQKQQNKAQNVRRDPQNAIRKLFTGSTKTCIECKRCKTTSTTEEPFCCISLEVDDNINLNEAMQIYTQHELMRGDDKYSCDQCKRKCVAVKRLTLSKVPPVLVLHFKRFCYQFSASHHVQGVARKLADRVAFPERLDFAEMADSIHEEDRDTVLIDAEYDLYAVLVHSGPQLGYGHYYALIKSPDGYWYRMNDTQVIRVDVAHVLREQAYMLMYKRSSDKQMKSALTQIVKMEAKEGLEAKKEDVKVDVKLANNDYFESRCQAVSVGKKEEAMVDGMVLVEEQVASSKSKNAGLGVVANDRSEYVQVPPMATRPVIAPNAQKRQRNDDVTEAMEIFWPPMHMKDF